MLSTRAPAQVAQSVEQWTEKAFATPGQSALSLSPVVTARFWSRVDQSGGPGVCHPWTGSLDKDGYGVWYPERGVRIAAHRTALQLKLGRRLVAGEEARHVNGCKSRACCNPRHLEPGTHQQNIADREADGTTQRGQKHWKAKLTEADVIVIRARSNRESFVDIAADYGIGPNAIRKIVTRENWKHVAADLASGAMTIRSARAALGVTALLSS